MLSQFEIDVAGCAGGGGAEAFRDPSDQGACSMAVENHWGEAEAVLVAPVG